MYEPSSGSKATKPSAPVLDSYIASDHITSVLRNTTFKLIERGVILGMSVIKNVMESRSSAERKVADEYWRDVKERSIPRPTLLNAVSTQK